MERNIGWLGKTSSLKDSRDCWEERNEMNKNLTDEKFLFYFCLIFARPVDSNDSKCRLVTQTIGSALFKGVGLALGIKALTERNLYATSSYDANKKILKT